MANNKRGVKLDETLPPVIKSLQEGWSLALQNSATVSALFAGISSQLYSFFTSTDPKTGSYTRKENPHGAIVFMIFLSYASMLLNCGAAITSFVLVDTLTELPYLHARVEGSKYPSSAVVNASQTYLMRRYGVGKRWNFALCHWMFCYVTGMLCLVLQITTYVLLQEPNNVRIPITIISIFILLPLITYMIPRKTHYLVAQKARVHDSGYFEPGDDSHDLLPRPVPGL